MLSGVIPDGRAGCAAVSGQGASRAGIVFISSLDTCGGSVVAGMEGMLVANKARLRSGPAWALGATAIALCISTTACTRTLDFDDGLQVDTDASSTRTVGERREAELRQQIATDPQASAPRGRLARLLEHNGRYDEALAEYDELRSQRPDWPDSYLGPFRIYILQGQQRLAHRALEQFQERFPGDQTAVMVALTAAEAQQHARAGQYDAAIRSYRDAIALTPRDPQLWNGLGAVYLTNDQLPEALQAYKEAAKANPQDGEARDGQSEVLARMAAPIPLPIAESAARPAGDGAPVQASSTARGGTRPPRAPLTLSDDPSALRARAAAYEETEDWESAAALYRRLDALPGPAVDSRVWRRISIGRDLAQARRLVAAQRHAAANTILAEVRRRDPEEAEAWVTLAELSLATGDPAQAWRDTERGLALDGKTARLHAVRIRALARLQRFDDARLAISQAQHHLGEPLVAALVHEVRQVEDRLGRPAPTHRAAATQATIDRLKAVGLHHLQQRRFKEARVVLEQAYQLAPNDHGIRRALAQARRGSGAWHAALPLLEQEFIATGDVEVGVSLAETYHRLDRDEEAGAVLQRLELSRDAADSLARSGAATAPGFDDLVPATDAILPSLRLPHGPLRGPSNKPVAPPSSSWHPGKDTIEVASAAGDLPGAAVSMNDAAPPHAAAFAGAAIDPLRQITRPRMAASRPAVQISEAPGGGDRDGWQQPRAVRAPSRSGRGVAHAAPSSASRSGEVVDPDSEEDDAFDARRGVERRHDPTSLGVPSHTDPAALVYEDPATADDDPHRSTRDQAARARAELLAHELRRRRAPKLGMSFRYDFLSSVADWRADELALFRFPVFVDLPAGPTTRFRLTGEPTFVDNGRNSDAGVAGMATFTGLPLGTPALIASAGIGSTPAGFPRRPYVTGFAEIDIKANDALVLTPFFERQPVLESMLSFRGRELVKGDRGTFIGKVIQDRAGARVGFDTPVHLNGIVEIAYSSLQGIRIPSNEKIDAFAGVGRTFELRGYENQLRPGFDLSFFHYQRDLGAPLRSADLDDPDAIRAAVRSRRTGGGYFSPDAFAQALARLDFSGPFFPETFGGASFLITGKLGGQWISGVDSTVFRNTKGGRLTGGAEAALNLPIEDIAAISIHGGALWANPYNRHFVLVNLVFPLSFD